MISDEINLMLFNQKYFEALIKVVYPHVSVNNIVPYSNASLQYVGSSKLFFGFFSMTSWAMGEGDPPMPVAIECEQNGNFFYAIPQQKLMIADKVGTDGGTANFIGFVADVDNPTTLPDDVPPNVVIKPGMKILKVLYDQFQQKVAVLVAGTPGHQLKINGTLCDDPITVDSNPEWLYCSKNLATVIGQQVSFVAFDGTNNGDPVYVTFTDDWKPYTFVQNEYSTSFSPKVNLRLPSQMEPPKLKIMLIKHDDVADTDEVLQTLYINDPGFPGDPFAVVDHSLVDNEADHTYYIEIEATYYNIGNFYVSELLLREQLP